MTQGSVKDPAYELAVFNMALTALDHTLFAPVPDQDAGYQTADLETLFPGSDALTAREALRVKEAANRVDLYEPQTLSPYQGRLLTWMLPRPWWERRLLPLIARLRRQPAQPFAEFNTLRDPMAASVWMQPEFCRLVALRLHRCLRTEVLMSPDRMSPTILSASFWWVLLAGLAPENEAGRRLRAHADACSKAEGWAGFWEQYLLLRLSRQGKSLPDATAQLPLFQMQGKGAESECSAARPGWQSEAPAWASSLIDRTI